MKNNGLKILTTALFLILSMYYLYPTLRNSMYQGQLTSLQGEEREEYLRSNFASIESTRERALKLGLDLRGGMLVSLEVRVADLIRTLAEDTDETFEAALQAANERAAREQVTVLDAFAEEMEAREPNYRLSRYFRNPDRDISRRSTNDEILTYLRTEADDAVDRGIEIIRQRVDRFGVSEPSIQKQGTRRIVVELPGVDDAERVRELLKGTARLEFHLMAEPEAVNTAMQRVIEYYEQRAIPDTTTADTTVADTTAGDTAQLTDASDPDTTAADTSVAGTSVAAADTTGADFLDDPLGADVATNELFEVFQPVLGGVRMGYATARDTAAARMLLFAPEVRAMWPREMVMMWSAATIGQTEEGFDLYEALAVRRDIEMEGDVIVDATPAFDELNLPEVSMTMNSEGAQTWARVTGANVGKQVAITMDNVVFSYPVVREKISFGRSSISNLESQEEAQDLVTMLKSGALPAPVDIVAEQTVGPSLGAESIRAGTISLVTGLVIVCVFMIFYYRTAGLVADLALLLNILFIFGILAGFNATLTLPGIAGIVLTIGMAVDANVLIFERIREEQDTGKTLKAAISSGYDNALSAILDANITTFLVAAILFSFGKGPIQGFAVTLMAGIVASLFTAIIVTRILFDWIVSERKRLVSFG